MLVSFTTRSSMHVLPCDGLIERGELPTPAPQHFLIGLRLGFDGEPVQVAVIPTYGPAFYTDATGARALARMLDARADELDGGDGTDTAPLPAPCPLCEGTSRATYNPFEDQFDPGGQDACPICTPVDPV